MTPRLLTPRRARYVLGSARHLASQLSAALSRQKCPICHKALGKGWKVYLKGEGRHKEATALCAKCAEGLED